MIAVEASVEFSMAHRLPQHQGHCRFLHGHNYVYTAQVVPAGEHDLDQGMVLDFHQVKKVLREVTAPYDHICLLKQGDALIDPLVYLFGTLSVRTLEEAPTVEALLVALVGATDDRLLPSWCKVHSARLSETQDCFAVYQED